MKSNKASFCLIKKSLLAVFITGILNASAFADNSPKIIGYYTNWSTYGANFQPSKINSKVDQINYAFMQVGACDPAQAATEAQVAAGGGYGCKSSSAQSGIQDWKLHPSDDWSDSNVGGSGNLTAALKSGKSVSLSIGGYTLSAPIRGAISPDNVETFSQSIIDFMANAEQKSGSNAKFAGVDIDWEPNGSRWVETSQSSGFIPVTKIDLANFYNFLKNLKSKLASTQTLSIAVTGNPYILSDVDKAYGGGYWKQIAALGVTIDLMTYDYNAQEYPIWNKAITCSYIQFNSPLKSDPSDKYGCLGTGEDKLFNTDGAVTTLISLGVPPSSIVIGVPAYGHAYGLNSVSDVTASPYVKPAVDYKNAYNIAVSAFGDIWTNREIFSGNAFGIGGSSENTTWKTEKDEAGANQSYATALVNGINPALITYTSYNDAKNVMQYAKQKGLAGVMVWSLDQDVQPNDVNYTPNNSIIEGLAAGK